MFESIQFRNFKPLRDTTLPLGRFTLIVGPNGSGKSTALQAFRLVANPGSIPYARAGTASAQPQCKVAEVILHWAAPHDGVISRARWSPSGIEGPIHEKPEGTVVQKGPEAQALTNLLNGIRVFSLNAKVLANPVALKPNMELMEDGGQLAGVLDRIRDQAPERFEALSHELGRWLPEFDRILFDTPGGGQRAILLRTTRGHHKIPAQDLSQGTLLALALLTVAYMPDPPPLVCLEEPDRGLHPRLLPDVRDAIYRLSHPEDFAESREPVQVVATTHSPYLLDHYRDNPEEIILAHTDGQQARFERLSERCDVEEILQDAHLGDVWYSGILGGVPSER